MTYPDHIQRVLDEMSQWQREAWDRLCEERGHSPMTTAPEYGPAVPPWWAALNRDAIARGYDPATRRDPIERSLEWNAAWLAEYARRRRTHSLLNLIPES